MCITLRYITDAWVFTEVESKRYNTYLPDIKYTICANPFNNSKHFGFWANCQQTGFWPNWVKNQHQLLFWAYTKKALFIYPVLDIFKELPHPHNHLLFSYDILNWEGLVRNKSYETMITNLHSEEILLCSRRKKTPVLYKRYIRWTVFLRKHSRFAL